MRIIGHVVLSAARGLLNKHAAEVCTDNSLSPQSPLEVPGYFPRVGPIEFEPLNGMNAVSPK